MKNVFIHHQIFKGKQRHKSNEGPHSLIGGGGYSVGVIGSTEKMYNNAKTRTITHIHKHTLTHTHTQACTHTHIYVCYMNVHKYTHTQASTRVYLCIYIKPNDQGGRVLP